MLNQITASQNTQLRNDFSALNTNVDHSVKLPKLTIPNFYGDSCSWLDFWGQFTNAIDNNPNLTPIDKFSYLKSLLVSSTFNVVAGFSLTEENYNSAIDLLKNRFGHQDLVINAHMSKPLNLKQVKNAANVKKLRELYDSCEIQIRNLNSLGVTAGILWTFTLSNFHWTELVVTRRNCSRF
ncbi:uncharacterized protein LOC118199150 [Stegodyphus dumicola]|uniref:uncharacterized protein LOC118199150 n=1 Tax=Stegodyphus dumicola TaxID=202533 RepID=UPI0015ADDDFB|nr:uncharacterized protein LOC118199150 [Stegodyphus dumicola]